MKLFCFFLSIIILPSNIYSTEIATFKLLYIIDNSLEFDEFIKKLDTLKIEMQKELLIDEKYLNNYKNSIVIKILKYLWIPKY